MRSSKRAYSVIFSVPALLTACLFVTGCGGSSSTPPQTVATSGQNVMPLTVDAGPDNNYVNGAFASVTVCVPGSSTCQTIDGVLVDTGSYGLRILNSVLTISLPGQKSGGSQVGECAGFADGITWGGVHTADIQLGGETAQSVPIQVIGDSAVPATAPSDCSSMGTPEDTLQTLLANGILGVGQFPQDCGLGCTTQGNPTPPAGTYYTCSTSSCSNSFESLSQQVQNPVSLFATDNNGVIVELQSIGPSGAPSVSGSLVFGIGTQSNNGLGSASVFTLDPTTGNLTTQYKGQSYSSSFIDSGSNGIFFLNHDLTQIPVCGSNTNAPGFYCPDSTEDLSATNVGANGTTGNVDFSVANANTLVSSGNVAYNDLAGENTPPPSQPSSSTGFDWGLPFFFGRNVYTAIAGASTPAGAGPYYAY